MGQPFHTASTLGRFASSLCLCLCQTNLHMRVARQTPPNRKNDAHSTSAITKGGSAAGRSAALDPSALKHVSACAVSSTRSPLGPPSSDSVWAALSVRRRRCLPVAQQLGSFTAQPSTSHENKRSHGRTMALRLRFTSFCSRPWFRRTFVVTFCVRTSHADVCPELLQDAWEPGDPHLGCCIIVVAHQVVELRDMALHVRVSSCLFNQPAQGVLDRTVRSGPSSPVLATERVERVLGQRLLTHVPIMSFPQSTRGARACIWGRAESQRRGHPPLRILRQF